MTRPKAKKREVDTQSRFQENIPQPEVLSSPTIPLDQKKDIEDKKKEAEKVQRSKRIARDILQLNNIFENYTQLNQKIASVRDGILEAVKIAFILEKVISTSDINPTARISKRLYLSEILRDLVVASGRMNKISARSKVLTTIQRDAVQDLIETSEPMFQ